MSDFELINKAAHRIYPTHLKEHEKGSSFSWSSILPVDAKLRLGDSEGHKQTDDRNSHTLTHKLKGGASIEFNIVKNGQNHIAMAKYHKGGKLFTAIHSHEDPSKAIKTAYDSVARRIVTEEAEIALIEKMEKRIEKKTGKLSDKKEKIDVEPSEEKELKESTNTNNPGYGMHGQLAMEHGSDRADALYRINHAGIKRHLTKSGHLADVKNPNITIRDYMDSKHGRHLYDHPHDPAYLEKDFSKFKKSYNPKDYVKEELEESTPPGMESWVKKNKANFVKEYGEKKGHEVLYATAWKLHNKMNEMEELKEGTIEVIPHFIGVMPDGRKVSPFSAGIHHVEKTGKWTWGVTDHNGNYTTGMSRKPVESKEEAIRIAHEVAAKTRHKVKLSESTHTYTKEGLAKQIKYHENRAAHHDSEAQASFNKAQDLIGDKADLHFNAAKGHKAIADLHRKHIYDLKSSAGLTEAEGKVEMMYLSKGFISPKLAEKLARESKHLGTDKSTGEQHYLHPQHGRMALVPHKSGEFQFRLAEEIEQLDELSPHTLSMYTRLSAIDKSKHAGMGTVARAAQYRAEHAKDKKTAKEEKERADFHQKKEDKRLNGIIQATSKLARKAYGLHEASRPAPHPDKVVMTSSIRKDLGGGYMAKTRNGHFYKLDVNALGEPGKGRELPKLGAVLDTSKHKFIGKDKVDLNLLKESTENNYLGQLVGKYITHSGKTGMEIRRHSIGTYSYSGEWGAGGGHSKAEMDKTANMLLRVHPRHKIEKHYFGDVHNIKEDLNLLKEGFENDVEIGTAAVIHPAPSNKMILKEHIGNETDSLKNYIHTHPILGRFSGKEEKYNHKEDGEVRAFHEPNGKHVLVYSKKTTPYGTTHKAAIYYKRAENEPMLPQTRKFVGHEPDHVLHAVAHEFTPIKEDLDHDHPDMKTYHAACKARDEAHLASIRYRMNHDIKQPAHRAKYDELEAEHHRLRDIEDAASEKVNGRLFAHHALKEEGPDFDEQEYIHGIKERFPTTQAREFRAKEHDAYAESHRNAAKQGNTIHHTKEAKWHEKMAKIIRGMQ